jgi:hypothetical protein
MIYSFNVTSPDSPWPTSFLVHAACDDKVAKQADVIFEQLKLVHAENVSALEVVVRQADRLVCQLRGISLQGVVAERPSSPSVL